MFCKNCIYWRPAYTNTSDVFGICTETMVNFKVKAEATSKLEESVLYTEQHYGCIYFRKAELVVTKLPEQES